MLTKYASAVVLSAELVPTAPRHAHDHPMGEQRTFKQAHRHAFVYEKRPGYLYVRSRAISSRCNDNYDEFPAAEIKEGYRSFIGKPVFVNHRNDNHRRARGVIIDAALHEDTNPDGSADTWAEVLMEVDAVKFPKLAKAILAGHVDRTSMGTDVAYSKCSFCGNKAATPLEYCQHIPKLKGKRIRRTTASGAREDVLVREICYGLKFFENSLLVEEPADPTAFFLGVEGEGVAAQGGLLTTPINMSAGVVTEAMLRAAGPGHQKTAANYRYPGEGRLLFTVVGPMGIGWEMHVAGCGDLAQPKYQQYRKQMTDIPGDTWRDAAEVWFDEELQDMGYSIEGDLKVFPCAKSGVPKEVVQKALDPSLCPGTGRPIDNPSRRLYLPCPICGQSVGTGRGVVPRHKKQVPYVYGTLRDGPGKHIAHRDDGMALCGAGKLDYPSDLKKEPVRGTCAECIALWQEQGVTAARHQFIATLQRHATVYGTFTVQQYLDKFPDDFPSWTDEYNALWLTDDGKCIAVTAHAAYGYNNGFSKGYMRLLIHDYPRRPTLEVNMDGTTQPTQAQISSLRTLQNELDMPTGYVTLIVDRDPGGFWGEDEEHIPFSTPGKLAQFLNGWEPHPPRSSSYDDDDYEDTEGDYDDYDPPGHWGRRMVPSRIARLRQTVARAIYGEFTVEEYLDGIYEDKFPSWTGSYNAFWTLPSGKVVAVYQHSDYGYEKGFDGGAIRCLLMGRILRREYEVFGLEMLNETDVTDAQISTISKLMSEFGIARSDVTIENSNGPTMSEEFATPGQLRSFLKNKEDVYEKWLEQHIWAWNQRYSSSLDASFASLVQGTALNASFAKLAEYERKTKTPEWDEEDEVLHPRNKGQFSKAPGAGAAPKDGEKPEGGEEGEAKAEGGDQAPSDRPAPKKPGEGTTTGTGTKDDPIKTDDVYAAAEALQKGQYVQLSQPKVVSTLLDRLSKVVKKAKEEGTEVKIDLCQVTVQGTNLFCVESKGIPRIKMPQLKSKQPKPGSKALKEIKPGENGEYDIQAQFRQMLIDKGVKMEQVTEKATFLKASQSQLRGEKVAGMAGWISGALNETGKVPEGERIFISKDNYIVDGHHRWAAIVGTDWADGQGDELEMDVERVDMEIIELLDLANKFADEWGLPQLDLYDQPAPEQQQQAAAARLNQSFGSLVRTAAAETMDLPLGEYPQAPIWTINYRPQDEARIRALAPHVQNGPNYRRGVIENLKDYSLFAGRGDDQAAELYLLYAEGKTVREAQDIIEGRLPFDARRKLAYGEQKAPAAVDTLRDASCPVCGEENAYDAEKCLVCGFVKPPDTFMDPDLEQAKQVDLRQETDDTPGGSGGGGEKLVCDKCGFEVETDDLADQAPGGAEDPDAADPNANPFAKKDEADPAADPNAAPEAEEEKPGEAKPEAPKADDGKVDVKVDDGSDTEDEGEDEDEIDPATGQPKKKPKPPIKSSSKLATAPPTKTTQPMLKNPSLAHPPAQMDAPADGAGLESKDPQEEIPETTPQAGDTCPECGQGTLRPKAETAKLDNEKPETGDDGGKAESKPPWEKGDESKGKEQKESSATRPGASRRNGVEMRPALAALAEQQKTIDAQARQIKALKRAVEGIARLAGVDEHPKFAALMKIADENNPAQPIPDPPAEAPAQTTEDALGDLNDEDVEQIGSTSLTDVSADATTDVMSTEVVLDEPLDLNEQDPTKPVAGTEGPQPLADVKTETEVRAGNPNNPDTMFPLEGDFAQRATTGSREARTIAALRLARLRIQSGIASGDDLSIGTAIAQSNMSDEVIQAEIGTLAKVVKSAGQQPRQASRNLVPRAAAGQGRRPSLAEATVEAPPIQMVGSVEADEILFE